MFTTRGIWPFWMMKNEAMIKSIVIANKAQPLSSQVPIVNPQNVGWETKKKKENLHTNDVIHRA